MTAVVLEHPGAGAVLLREMAVPSPGPRDLLIRVRAAAVNPRDWMMVAGRYPFSRTLPRRPFVPGADVAGEVAVAGRRVSGFRPGDRVFAMQTLAGGLGAFAPWCVVRAGVCARIPENLCFETAAGIPLAGLTALQGLGRRLAGRRVLVIGASGGVGHLAVQIARAAGAEVTGVCSGRNVAFARDLGCRHVINYEMAEFDAGSRRYDRVFDTIGRESPARCRQVLMPGGVHVTTVPRRVALRRAAVDLGLGWVPRRRPTRLVLVRSSGPRLAELAALADEGRLKCHVDRTWPLSQVDDALSASRSGRTRGKLVLRIDQDRGEDY
jgi:NADPH:quinone reductase-like Zn-dependent oxidoreductase